MSNIPPFHTLIIEDDPYSQDILTHALQQVGFTATIVSDGKGALQALARLIAVHVIFLDLDLPTVNGFDVFAAIRADNRFSRIPIVAYTAHTNQMARARQSGFQGFLSKPINAANVPDILERILNNEEVWE